MIIIKMVSGAVMAVMVWVVGFMTTYICNQCLSPLKLWVNSNPAQGRCTRYNIMW